MSSRWADQEAMRALRQALAKAGDGQLAVVVGIVDRLDGRWNAWNLLAPVRHRLAGMDLPRQLRLGRLLFLPLEPLLMPAREWRRGDIGVPRTALAPLIRQIEHGLGPMAQQINAHLEGTTTEQTEVVHRVGSVLWPAAARVLHHTPISEEWAPATGLPPSDHTNIAGCVAALLSEAVWLSAAALRGAEGEKIDDAEFRSWQEAAAARHPGAEQALTATLLARFPQAVRALAPTPSQTTQESRGMEQILDFLLERIESATGPDRTACTSRTLQGHASLLVQLLPGGPGFRISRRAQIEQLRRQLADTCVSHYAESLSRSLLAPAIAESDEPPLARLEPVARGLRRLEIAGRRLGSGEIYERLARLAGQEIAATPHGNTIARARLAEILAGPEVALTGLAAQRAVA